MKKRGISLASIVIAVVIMFVLLSTISISITYSVSNAKKLSFVNEIYNIQNVVTEYIKNEGVIPAGSESITITIDEITAQEVKHQFEGETVVDDKINLSVLEFAKVDIVNTNYGNKTLGKNDTEKSKDVYAVSDVTGKVYYIAGFKSGKITYYTLTDELKQMIEKDQNVTIGEKTITFTPSKKGWSNEAVTVTVFVPSEFETPSITINNPNITYTYSQIEGGTSYTVNDSKVNENYTITVNYTKNGISSSATYQTKMDNVAPIISKDEAVVNTATHIKGLNANDNDSGIKYFKYAEGVIETDDIKTYMGAYGRNINKARLKFEAKRPYTLYAEDKSGNFTIIYVDGDGNLTNVKPKDYRYPVIPKGFIASKIVSETTVSQGLVIYEIPEEEREHIVWNADEDSNGILDVQEKYNQFVWIPVDDISEFKTIDWGKGTTGEQFKSLLEPMQHGSMDTVVEHNNMYNSVKRYGGFYLGRYEAGKGSVDGVNVAISKRNVTVWNSIHWSDNNNTIDTEGAVYHARIMYKDSTSVVSTLCYSVQWDAAMVFMQDVDNPNVEGAKYIYDSTGMGVYKSKNAKDTGQFSVKNIYDLAGNLYEWTMEGGSMGGRTARGGYYLADGLDFPASRRYSFAYHVADPFFGFRVALYLI